MREYINKYFEQSHELLLKCMESEPLLRAIEQAATIMYYSIRTSNKIVAIGNGGSMSDAMHFCSELTGRYKKERAPLPAIAINDASHMSCVSNDYDYVEVFSRWLRAHGKHNDTLLVISTSGNSANVVKAAHTAMKLGMSVVALTGKDGGEIGGMPFADITEIRVPSDETNKIQEIHIQIIHLLVEMLEQKLGV